jgi:hypothetical protein
MKWADLVKRPTMTHIELYPCEVRGKPTMKSMQMSSHFQSGMLKGCRFSVGLKWLACPECAAVGCGCRQGRRP